MISSITTLRVRYAETDRMGFAYYGHYAEYFEIARTDWCRNIGLTYKEIEDQGILMPVLELNIQYKAPAYYDDLLSIKVDLKEKPGWKMRMEAESRNESDQLNAKMWVELAFVNKTTKRPVRVPDFITQRIDEYWQPVP